MAFQIRDLMVGVFAAEQGPGPCSCIRATAAVPKPPDCRGISHESPPDGKHPEPAREAPPRPKRRQSLDELRRDLRSRLELAP